MMAKPAVVIHGVMVKCITLFAQQLALQEESSWRRQGCGAIGDGGAVGDGGVVFGRGEGGEGGEVVYVDKGDEGGKGGKGGEDGEDDEGGEGCGGGIDNGVHIAKRLFNTHMQQQESYIHVGSHMHMKQDVVSVCTHITFRIRFSPIYGAVLSCISCSHVAACSVHVQMQQQMQADTSGLLYALHLAAGC